MNQFERIARLEIALPLRDQLSRGRSLTLVLSGLFLLMLLATPIRQLTPFNCNPMEHAVRQTAGNFGRVA